MSATSSRTFRGTEGTDELVGTTRRRPTIRRESPLHALVATDGRAAATIARLALGLVMFPHGAQKMLRLVRRPRASTGHLRLSHVEGGVARRRGRRGDLHRVRRLAAAHHRHVHAASPRSGSSSIMIGAIAHDASAERLLHELDGQAGRRRLRVPPARDRPRARRDHPRRRCALDRPRAHEAPPDDARGDSRAAARDARLNHRPLAVTAVTSAARARVVPAVRGWPGATSSPLAAVCSAVIVPWSLNGMSTLSRSPPTVAVPSIV